MYKHQLIDAKNSLAFKTIVGLCTDTDEFVAILNEAMRRLIRRGGFWETEQLVRMCAYNGCLTWPRYVGTVLGIRFCACDPHEIRNNWYAILGPRGCGGFSYTHTMRDNGTSPFYNEITGDAGKLLRVYPTKAEDVGKTITFYGIDAGGQPLQQLVNGIWQRGLTLTIEAPYVSTSVLIRKVNAVVRERTQANVLVYEYDSVSDTVRDLAIYEPTETHPSYRRSVIQNFKCIPSGCDTDDGVRRRVFDALVKLEFIEAVNDQDFLAISNFDALKFAIQAIRLEESNQDEQAEIKMVKAVRELNHELKDKNPNAQTTVSVDAVMGHVWSPI